MPAITLAVTSNNVTFTPTGERGIGTIRVTNDDDNERNLFRIVDGQHRRHAIEELLTEYEEQDAERWTALGESGLSVTLYAESDTVKIRQMFATMALSKPTDRNTQSSSTPATPSTMRRPMRQNRAGYSKTANGSTPSASACRTRPMSSSPTTT